MQRRNPRRRRGGSAAPSGTGRPVRRTTRNTSKKPTTDPAPEPAPESVPKRAQRGSRKSSEPLATPFSKPRRITSSQIPRRGARRSTYQDEGSVMSIPTALGDNSETGEVPNFFESSQDTRALSMREGSEDVLDRDEVNPADGEDDGFDEEETINNEIRDLSLPDLERASDDLMKLLRNPKFEDPVYRRFFDLKHNALMGVRDLYEEESSAPFIDWSRFDRMYENPDDFIHAAETMVCANIVTGFHALRSAQYRDPEDLSALLNALNAIFPRLFTVSDDVHRDPDLVLDIRTWFYIDFVERTDGIDLNATIAEIFCLPSEATYPHRFSHGPYKSLWAENQTDNTESEFDLLCGSRITKIIGASKRDRETLGVDLLKQEFPLEKLLGDLEAWFETMYATLKEAHSAQDGAMPAAPSVVEEVGELLDGDDIGVGDSQTDIGESQPIVRAGTADEEGPSLYQNAKSLRYLDGRATGTTPVPPSNQQQNAPPPGAPRDYRDHRNSELLRTPPPGSAFPPFQAQGNGEGPSRNRRYEEAEIEREQAGEPASNFPEEFGGGVEPADEEEEEEDPFETDTRPVDKGKRAAIATSMPPPKRPRIAAVASTSSHPTPPIPPTSSGALLQTSSQPQPPPSTAMSTTLDPSQPDFNAIKITKEQVSRQHRLSQQAGFRQRHAWSDEDCAILIERIRERHASWAAIESGDKDKFERPRNQQAYRDKARNLKVDYLMTNAVLPPCFDLVALGKKEIERLISFGKNPYRREADVDENGYAIHTEYKEPARRSRQAPRNVEPEPQTQQTSSDKALAIEN